MPKKSTRRGSRSRRQKTLRPRPSVVAILKEQFPIIKFVGLTSVFIVAFFLATRTAFVNQHFVGDYTKFVASCSRSVLRLLGVDATGYDTFVFGSHSGVDISEMCNGLEVGAILFAALIAFPAPIKSKILGLAIGYPVLFLVNQLRIVTLFLLNQHAPDLFWATHDYYAQIFVILAMLVIFILWLSRLPIHGSKNDATIPH